MIHTNIHLRLRLSNSGPRGVYRGHLVERLTMVLKCIPGARSRAVPENWGGNVSVTIRELSFLVENTWEAERAP